MSKAAKYARKKAGPYQSVSQVNAAWIQRPPLKVLKLPSTQPRTNNTPVSSPAQPRRQPKLSSAYAEALVEPLPNVLGEDNPPTDTNNRRSIESHFETHPNSSAGTVNPIPRPVTAPPKLTGASCLETPTPALLSWPAGSSHQNTNGPSASASTSKKEKTFDVTALFRTPMATSPITTTVNPSVVPQPTGSPGMGVTAPLCHPAPRQPYLSHPMSPQQWESCYYAPPQGYDSYTYWKHLQPLHSRYPCPERLFPHVYPPSTQPSPRTQPCQFDSPLPIPALQVLEPVPTKASKFSMRDSRTPSGQIGGSTSRPDTLANVCHGVPSLGIGGSWSPSAEPSGTWHVANHVTLPPSPETSQSRWVAGSLQRVPHKIQELLNKLTMDNFGPVSDQIIQYANRSEQVKDGSMLMQVVKVVFASARNDSIYAEMHARLCRKMTESLSPNIQDETIHSWDKQPVMGGLLFRKYLFALCQEEFGRGWCVKGIDFAAASKARRQGIGLVRFMAQLFKQQMLAERVIHECIKKLMSNTASPKDEEIESLCELLAITAQTLDNYKACDHMDAYFERMGEMLDTLDLNWRLRFMLLDVIELRARQWRARITNGSTERLAAYHRARLCRYAIS